MRLNRILTLALMMSGAALTGMTSSVYGQGYTDIKVKTVPAPEVRYTSGRSVYVEGLVDGRWMGRYRSAGGRINVPYELYPLALPDGGMGAVHPFQLHPDEAFQLQIESQWLSTGWKWLGAHELPRTEHGARHFVVELSSTLRPINLQIHTLLDGTPVLTRWLEITNTSQKPTALTAVYPWAGRLWRSDDYRSSLANPDDPVYEVGYFTEVSHGWEGWFHWFPVVDQTMHLRCDVGHASSRPFFVARNNATGEYFIGNLAWTANRDLEVKSDQETPGGGGMPGLRREANLWFRMGPWASSPQRVIAPGETVQTPAVHLGHVEGDFDAAVQAMHEHIRQSVVPTPGPERPYRIEYGVYGDQGYVATHVGGDPTVGSGINEENVKQQIDLAAAIGVELFIIDAGWWDTYGDWTPSVERFPHGLAPLADYAHQKGMLFGLYAEVEGARGDWTRCSWCKQHPDWFFPNFKNLLNLTKPEVAAHVEAQLSRMIEQYKLDLYRHDFNTPFTGELGQTLRDGFEENDYWRYYAAWYGILEHLHKKYPKVVFQHAAAGGMRHDLGMAGRWHEWDLTDGLNVPHDLRNYAGQTLALPPEHFVNHVGIPAISANRGHLDTHLRVSFCAGSTPLLAPVAPTLEDLAPDIRQAYLHYAGLYKSFIRPLLPSCRMFHHAPINASSGVDSSPWFVVEFAAPDRSKGWVMIVRMANGGGDAYPFRPRGLDPARTYRVTFDSTGTTARIEGLRLIQEGIPIRLESNLYSELLLFEAE